MEKRIRNAKEVIWNRRAAEYIRSLIEWLDVTKGKHYHPEISEIVLIVGDSKNQRQWNHQLICELFMGKGIVIRGIGMVVCNKIRE